MKIAGFMANPTVIAAAVGAIASLGVAVVQRPSTIRETKESISAITVSDRQLKQLAGSVFRLQASTTYTSGFLIEQRYLVTTYALVRRGGKSVRVYRRFGQPDSTSFVREPAVIDSAIGVTILDLGARDPRATWLTIPNRVDRGPFDRVFALGYTGGSVLTVREGRVVADLVANPAFYGVDTTEYSVPSGLLVADLDIPVGMAGSPVFLRDGTLLGFVYLVSRATGIALVVPTTYIGDTLLRAKGGS